MALLQDIQLRLGQVQGRAASSVQGIYPGPYENRQREARWGEGERGEVEGERCTYLLVAVW
jgi:hypothetical protein